jgi:hypothetical protein
MSKFMKGIKGGIENKTVTAADIDAIADKLHSEEVIEETPVTTPVVEVENDKEELHRLTIDIPKELFDQMKKDTKRRGQTIKGFIVSLIYDHYEK